MTRVHAIDAVIACLSLRMQVTLHSPACKSTTWSSIPDVSPRTVSLKQCSCIDACIEFKLYLMLQMWSPRHNSKQPGTSSILAIQKELWITHSIEVRRRFDTRTSFNIGISWPEFWDHPNAHQYHNKLTGCHESPPSFSYSLSDRGTWPQPGGNIINTLSSP